MRIRQYVEFCLRSRTITAADLTARLLLEPDEVAVMGSRDPVRVVPRHHRWQVNAPSPRRRIDDQLADLVTRLTPVAEQIGALVAEGSVEATLSVVRHFDDEDGEEDEGTPPDLVARGIKKLGGQHHLLGWHLDRAVLDFLVVTGAELDVDEYG